MKMNKKKSVNELEDLPTIIFDGNVADILGKLTEFENNLFFCVDFTKEILKIKNY